MTAYDDFFDPEETQQVTMFADDDGCVVMQINGMVLKFPYEDARALANALLGEADKSAAKAMVKGPEAKYEDDGADND